MKDFLKKNLFALAVGLLAALLGIPDYGIEATAEPEPIPFAQYAPDKGKEDCPVTVRVKGLVDLTRVLEVHCETAGPEVVCESAVPELWEIDTEVRSTAKATDAEILAKVQPPVKDRIIGYWHSYSLSVERVDKLCKGQTPVSDEPKKE